MSRKVLVVWLGGLLVLGVASRWATSGGAAGRCRLDGNRIVPIYRVDLMQGTEPVASFCCVSCAREWPRVPSDAWWRVRDEVTGETLESSVAAFVESSVVTIPSRQDRTHVFRRWPDAMSHADAFDGRRIPNPLDPPVPGQEEP